MRAPAWNRLNDPANQREQIREYIGEMHEALEALEAKLEGVAAAGLAAIDFASDEAAELALDAGVRPAELANVGPSGSTGYVKADVLEAIEAREQVEDEDKGGEE